MHVVRKSVLLPYSDRQMYALVERVEDYPAFLPWCGGSEVVRESDERVIATVHIHYRGLKQRFTTINEQDAPRRISVRLRDGPFKRLEGEWLFHALGANACKVEFSLEYAFAGGLLGRALAPVFDHIARSFIDAFVQRAEQVYGHAV